MTKRTDYKGGESHRWLKDMTARLIELDCYESN